MQVSLHTQLHLSTNAEEMLVQGPMTEVEQIRPLMGVSWDCTTSDCIENEIFLSITEGSAPAGVTYGPRWTEVTCKQCGAMYRIDWPHEDSPLNTITVHRLGRYKTLRKNFNVLFSS